MSELSDPSSAVHGTLGHEERDISFRSSSWHKKLLSNFSKDVDSDSALKVRISGEWSHFSFHMERTVDVPSIIGLLNH
jgi:hypothetical protein